MSGVILHRRHSVFHTIAEFCIFSTFLFLYYSWYDKQHFPHIFNYFGSTSARISVVHICQKQMTLRDYSLALLQCKNKNVTYISTDVSILYETIFNITQHQIVSYRNCPYLQSDAFIKFKAFHHSANFSVSVYPLDEYIRVIRIPVLDTVASPNNDSRFSYIFPLPIIHSTQRIISPFQFANNWTYSIRKIQSYESAFLIVTDAVAHSSNGNVLVQTCSRAITVTGCSSSNTNTRLQSKFPFKINPFMCAEQLRSSHSTIISVKKLVVIAHTWYEAFYHVGYEAMSRLMILHELILFDPDIYILLQYPIYRQATKELFNLFGIAENRFIYYHSGMEDSTLIRANIMFVPRGINCGGAPPSLLEQIHIKALTPSNNGIIPPKPYFSLPLPIIRLDSENPSVHIQTAFRVKTGPIVLISRPHNRARSILNEIDILNFLTREYPRIPLVIFYGNMSLVDTIVLFHSVRVLVAPHGAGLVHLLWMRPGTAMVEISSRIEYNECYQAVATYRGISTAIYFDATASRGSALKVDMHIFTQLFKKVMKERY